MQRIWEPEVVIDESLARELIREQFPSLAVASISLLGTGWDNTAFLVDSRYVFRFPRRKVAVELLRREASALPLIVSRVSLSVPVPEFHGEPSSVYHWPFAGYELLPGTTACSLALTSGQRATLAVSIAKFLRQLHAINVEDGRDAGLFEDTLGKLSLDKWVPRIRQHLHEFRAAGFSLDWNLLNDWIERIDQIRPKQTAPHVVHGDFYVRHLLLNEVRELAGVIDWGDVHLSDPAVDLSVVYTFLPAEAHRTFFETYGRVTDDTLCLARMRAIAYGCNLLAYARDLNDQTLIDESVFMLRNSAASA
jgi:aminoglycoside phosphotransferase (APT) family kinase protein